MQVPLFVLKALLVYKHMLMKNLQSMAVHSIQQEIESKILQLEVDDINEQAPMNACIIKIFIKICMKQKSKEIFFVDF